MQRTQLEGIARRQTALPLSEGVPLAVPGGSHHGDRSDVVFGKQAMALDRDTFWVRYARAEGGYTLNYDPTFDLRSAA
jgi:hypothetical protein